MQANKVRIRERLGRKQPVRLQLFAAETDHHQFAAEIGVLRDVAKGTDRNCGIRRVNCHAAAVDMLQSDHAIDVRVVWQQFRLDAPDSVFDNARDTLDCRGDPKKIARPGRSVRVPESLKGPAFKFSDRA